MNRSLSLPSIYGIYAYMCVYIYRKGKVCVWEELSLCRRTCTYVCVYINIYMAGKLVCKELSSLSKHSSKYMNGVRELHSFVNIWHVLAVYMYMSVQTVLSIYSSIYMHIKRESYVWHLYIYTNICTHIGLFITKKSISWVRPCVYT